MKSPYLMFLGPIAGLLLGVAFKFRLLPFLSSDTILSGGQQVPTATFANFMARIFFIFAVVSFAVAVIYLLIQRRRQTSENRNV